MMKSMVAAIVLWAAVWFVAGCRKGKPAAAPADTPAAAPAPAEAEKAPAKEKEETKDMEVSSHPAVVSCTYSGVTTEESQPVIKLVFKNNSDKDIKVIHGAFTITAKETKTPLYTTGITYGHEVKVKDTADFTLFSKWLPMDGELYSALTDNPGGQDITFQLTKLEYPDNTKKSFKE